MSVVIAMVPCSEVTQLDIEAIQSELAKNWPELPAATDVSREEITATFQLGPVAVIFGVMPAPIPWSDLEGPCETSMLYPKAADDLKDHKAHIIVTLTGGDLDPVPSSTLLTQVTAALMATTPSALGVFWCNAMHLVRKDIFIDFAVTVMPDGPPVLIWVSFRVGGDSDRSSAGFTTGMEALGHMEFEAEGTPEPPSELHERLTSLCEYVIENGPVIKDGNTIGESMVAQIRVVYSDSSFGNENKVMRLNYVSGKSPSTEPAEENKPWWKFW
ncbi:MAG: hypothetical protein ACI9G1_001411 [Pirellulaceae bacterium]|jgi:hypothetical protein